MSREDEIRIIAYDIWQREGCLDGYDCDHWFQAEMLWEEQQKKVAPPRASKTKLAQPTFQSRRDRDSTRK